MKEKKSSEIKFQPQPDSAEKHRSINYTLKSISTSDLEKIHGVWKWEVCRNPERGAVSFMVIGVQSGEECDLRTQRGEV